MTEIDRLVDRVVQAVETLAGRASGTPFWGGEPLARAGLQAALKDLIDTVVVTAKTEEP